MRPLQRFLKPVDEIKRVARITKQWLLRLIMLLVTMALILIFKLGQGLWSVWIIAHRIQIIGLLLLILVVVIFVSPVIIEASSNPRPLTGPGRDPRQGP